MSTPIQNNQTTTIEITLTQEQKETLEKAAAISSQNLSEYLLAAALQLAEETPLQPEAIVLSEKDWQIVTSAIANPPELNPRLKAAIREYIADLEDERKWDKTFKKTQQQLIDAARRAKQEIAEGKAKPLDYDQL